MGFTIGGIREIRIRLAPARPLARSAPPSPSSPDCGAGTWCRAPRAAAGACSCGRRRLRHAGRPPPRLRPPGPGRGHARRRDRGLGGVPRRRGDAAGRPGVRRHRGGRTRRPPRAGPAGTHGPPPRPGHRDPATAAPTSSSPPAPPPSSPSCSTAWAGTTRPPRPARPRPRHAHHGPAVRPRRPRPGALAAPPRPGHGDASRRQARLLLGTLAYVAHRSRAVRRLARPYTAKRPSPLHLGGGRFLRHTDFRQVAPRLSRVTPR